MTRIRSARLWVTRTVMRPAARSRTAWRTRCSADVSRSPASPTHLPMVDSELVWFPGLRVRGGSYASRRCIVGCRAAAGLPAADPRLRHLVQLLRHLVDRPSRTAAPAVDRRRLEPGRQPDVADVVRDVRVADRLEPVHEGYADGQVGLIRPDEQVGLRRGRQLLDLVLARRRGQETGDVRAYVLGRGGATPWVWVEAKMRPASAGSVLICAAEMTPMLFIVPRSAVCSGAGRPSAHRFLSS